MNTDKSMKYEENEFVSTLQIVNELMLRFFDDEFNPISVQSVKISELNRSGYERPES